MPRRPYPQYPHRIEDSYSLFIRRRVSLLHTTTTRALQGLIVDEGSRRTDALFDLAAIASALLYIRNLFNTLFYPKAQNIRPYGRSAQRFAKAQIEKSTGQETSSQTQIESLLPTWVQANISLISSIDTRYLDEVAELVTASYRNGGTVSELSKQLSERFGVAKSRADLIAVDQIGTLNAQSTELIQTEMGVTQYIWQTQGDERVRPEHAARNGKTFSWDNPPADGHPGEPIRCRCVARAILSGENAGGR